MSAALGKIILIAAIVVGVPGLVSGAVFFGQEIPPAKTMDVRFPLPKFYADYAAQGGNPRPSTGRAVWAFPEDFDPSRTWPLLIVTSTTDGRRTSPDDLPFYQRPATREGWVVVATDAGIPARSDSDAWRLSMLAATLDEMHRQWPQSQAWPVAFAGISGGAKRTGFMASMLATTKTLRICGLFLCGINDDRISVAYQRFRPPPSFLEVPIWLSSGISDTIAPTYSHQHVQNSLARTGFKKVRLETFDGRHQVKPAELQRALRWFREVGKF